MTNVYVNGKRVTKEEISKIKIHSSTLDKIVLGKLTKGQKICIMAG